MALRSALGALFSGHPSDAFDYVFLEQDAVDATNQVKSAQEAIIQDQYKRGLVSEDEEMAVIAEIQQTAFPKVFAEEGNSIGDAFIEGAKEGIAQEQAFIQSATSGVLKTALGYLPWQVWLGLGIVAIVYAWPFITRARKMV